MATCCRCGKRWNSWGSHDAFCSSDCENENTGELTDEIWALYNILSDKQLNILKRIISISIGDENTAISIFAKILDI